MNKICEKCKSKTKPLYGNLNHKDLRVNLNNTIALSFSAPFLCSDTLISEEAWYRVMLCGECAIEVLDNIKMKLIEKVRNT